MRPLEIGVSVPTIGMPVNEDNGSWPSLKPIVLRLEGMGIDTIWIPDELVWKFPPDFVPMGTWECVSIAAAVAATTDRVNVGTWVLSALHRNPGLTVKAAETIDAIAGGRFIFGLGAGHSGSQGKAFGYPPDKVVGRYEEALAIIVPLLRKGHASFEGAYHSAFEQDNVPRGPTGADMPLMLAGHGPRTIGLAVEFGDIWSAFATESSHPEAFVEMLDLVARTCEEKDREPTTLGRSIGVFVELTDAEVIEASGLGVPLRGSPAEVAEQVHLFAEMGVTMLELIPGPFNEESMDELAELIEILDA